MAEWCRVLVLISANNLLIYRKYKSLDRNDEYFLAIKFPEKLLLSALPELKTPSSENLPLNIPFKFMLLLNTFSKNKIFSKIALQTKIQIWNHKSSIITDSFHPACRSIKCTVRKWRFSRWTKKIYKLHLPLFGWETND